MTVITPCSCELHPACSHPTNQDDSLCKNPPLEGDIYCKYCRENRQAVQVKMKKAELDLKDEKAELDLKDEKTEPNLKK